MSSSKYISLSVGTILSLFFFVLGNIILFGKTDTINQISNNLFKTLYFLFTLVILWTIYLLNRSFLHTKTEHILIVLALIIFSASVANLASNLKGTYDVNQYISEYGTIEELQTKKQNYYDHEQVIVNNLETIKSNNKVLEYEVDKLTDKINNKEPIIIETIVIIPAEIIYEEETVPVYREREEDEKEHEEDDDD